MSEKEAKIEDQAKHISALEKRATHLIDEFRELRARYIKLENDSLERINDLTEETIQLRKRIIEMNARDYAQLRAQIDEKKVAGCGESPAAPDRSS